MTLARGPPTGQCESPRWRLQAGRSQYSTRSSTRCLWWVGLVVSARTRAGEGGRAAKWLRRLAHPQVGNPREGHTGAKDAGCGQSLSRSGGESLCRAQSNCKKGLLLLSPAGRDAVCCLRNLPPCLAQLTGGVNDCGGHGARRFTSQWLAREYPAIRVIDPPHRFLRRCRHSGIAAAQSRGTLLLNNDMIVEPGFISALEGAFAAVPGVVLCIGANLLPARHQTGRDWEGRSGGGRIH